MAAGEVQTYTLRVTNTGPTTATNVVIYDLLPLGFAYEDAAFDPPSTVDEPKQCTSGVSCALGDLAVGASVTVTLYARVPSGAIPLAASNWQNYALATMSNPELDWSDNDAWAQADLARRVDLWLIKNDNPDPVTPGEWLEYTVIVWNDGSSDAIGPSLAPGSRHAAYGTGRHHGPGQYQRPRLPLHYRRLRGPV